MRKVFAFVLLFTFLMPILGTVADSTVTLDSVLAQHGYSLDDFDYWNKLPSASNVIVFHVNNDPNDVMYLFVYNGDCSPANIGSGRNAKLPSINISFSIRPRYASYQNENNMVYTFYRNYQVLFSWASSDSTLTLTSLKVKYTTVGSKYSYPSCVTDMQPTYIGTGEHSVNGSASNPMDGVLYSSAATWPNFAFDANCVSYVDIYAYTNQGTVHDNRPVGP